MTALYKCHQPTYSAYYNEKINLNLFYITIPWSWTHFWFCQCLSFLIDCLLISCVKHPTYQHILIGIKMHIILLLGNNFTGIFLFSNLILILRKKNRFIVSHKLLLSVNSGFNKLGILSLCLSVRSLFFLPT